MGTAAPAANMEGQDPMMFLLLLLLLLLHPGPPNFGGRSLAMLERCLTNASRYYYKIKSTFGNADSTLKLKCPQSHAY